MVIGDEVLDREPEGLDLVINTYEQWNIHKDNFNMRSLQRYHAATEEVAGSEVMR
jgi:hypothetical protein